MKAKELMIGDWVRLNDSYYQIEDVSNNGWVHLLYNNARVHLPTDYIVEYLRPIPLTPEILEKNGFVNDFYEDETIADNGAAITFQGYSYHDDGILVTYCNETIHATNDYTDAYIAIRGTSVSLLQHVMRLCGIDKEITLA